MEGAIRLILKHQLDRGLQRIYATGGGAHKFKELFKEKLGITLVPRDELGTVVTYVVKEARARTLSVLNSADPFGTGSFPCYLVASEDKL